MAPPFPSPKKFLLFSLLFIISLMVYEANGQGPRQMTLVLYLQDVAKGPNATVSIVTGIIGKEWSFNTFGTLFVVDDPVTSGPSPNDIEVGRAQGFLTISSLDGANMNVVLSILFTDPQYNGSSLEIQGINRQQENYREVSVVAGTGKFRFARGFAAFETGFYDPATARSIIRLTITLELPN